MKAIFTIFSQGVTLLAQVQAAANLCAPKTPSLPQAKTMIRQQIVI
jgi:hypothetical protein